MIHFDPTISLGTIVTILVGLGGGIGVYNAITTRITKLEVLIETMIKPMWEQFIHPTARPDRRGID